MKSFFYIVFGGLAALGIGVGIVRGVQVAWPVVYPAIMAIEIPKIKLPSIDLHLPSFNLHLPSLAAAFSSATISMKSAVTPGITEGTSISGMTRTIRYTASEEEDLIGAASLSLPSSGDKKVTANAYIVKSIDSEDTPISHNSDRIVPIASLTKLVTAIVAREKISPSSRITISREVMATYGNTAGFKVGETFIASDLYYPLLMVSSNDTAEAFARYYGRAKFIDAMNDFTQSIGAYRTYFADPSGLSPQNVSSANDLVIILKWIEQNDPGILDITKLKTKSVRSHTWTNPTHFLNWSNYAGGKNGYTDEANRTSAALFKMDHGSQTYAVVVLGSDARDNDMVTLLGKIK